MASQSARKIRESAVLDTSRLEMALGGDRDIISEILQMYEDSARSDMDGLWAAVNEASKEAIVQRSHALKGSSGNVGAEVMMDGAAAIETAGRQGKIDWVLEAMPELEAAFAVTLGACRQYRGA